MRSKITLIILCLALLFSCRSKQRKQGQIESQNISKQAFIMYFVQCDYDRIVCADSALFLYNQAIELDNENFTAYDNKISILTERKDIDELLKTSDQLIKIRPNKPFYKLQKGMFLLVKDRKSEANRLFQNALADYEEKLDGDLKDFDLNMEYINALTINDKFDEAQDHLKLMQNENYLDFQNNTLTYYSIEVDAKAKMIEYFKSKKTIDELFD